MSVTDKFGIRREEGPNGEVVLAVSEGGFAIDGEQATRYTQRDDKWYGEDGKAIPDDWQDALTQWVTPVLPPEPIEPVYANLVPNGEGTPTDALNPPEPPSNATPPPGMPVAEEK